MGIIKCLAFYSINCTDVLKHQERRWFIKVATLLIALVINIGASPAIGQAVGDMARDFTISVENGLFSVDIGQVPITDVLHSIVEQAGVELTVRGDLGISTPRSFSGLTLEKSIDRLLQGVEGVGVAFTYEPAAAGQNKSIPARLVVFGPPKSVEAPVSEAAVDGGNAASAPAALADGLMIGDKTRGLVLQGDAATFQPFDQTSVRFDFPTIRRPAIVPGVAASKRVPTLQQTSMAAPSKALTDGVNVALAETKRVEDLAVKLGINSYTNSVPSASTDASGSNDAALLRQFDPPLGWEMQVDNRAQVSISNKRAPLITSRYIFWGANWAWAKPIFATVQSFKSRTKQISGSVQGLDLDITGSVTAPRQGQLRYTWNISAATEFTGIMGGGVEFNLNLVSPSLGPNPPLPVLLPDNRGWSWQVGAGDGLKVEFDQPIANVYFEPGNPRKIRTMFVGTDVQIGQQTVTMTITLPDGGVIADTADQYGPVDSSNWYADALSPNTSPVDLSFLNHKPAGMHGFISAQGDQFLFEDGTPVRFWGANIAASAIFSEKSRISEQAKRIAQLGYNLIRIHHHDSTSWVRRTVIDQTQLDSRQFDLEVMDRLDFWIKSLKDEGIYVWLDLHVGRQFKAGDDVGPGFDEMLAHSSQPTVGAEGKGYNYFNDRLEELMQEFNENYLSHINPYTGLAYKDEPAIMSLLLTNENDLTSHFGNRMLPNQNNPYHNQIFDDAAAAFSLKTGLPYPNTTRTWLPGPSKVFLADREWQWNQRMISHLRTIGVKVPVATTHMWGDMALFGLPSLTAGEVIDVHSYGKEEALTLNPRYASNYISYMASGQVYGKPMSITEWNVPYPSVDRFTAPLYVASIASLQGWDAPMIYNYSQSDFRFKSRPTIWSTYPDIELTGMMPAAALLYRQEHVTESDSTTLIKLNRDQLYFTNAHPSTMASLRTLVEKTKIAIGLPDIPELDWDIETVVPPDVTVIEDPYIDFIPEGVSQVRSDTGELTRSWRHGYQIIDTAQTQAVHGWIGNRMFDLGDVSFMIRTSKAAVVVSSLDNNSISQSRRLLITAIGRAVTSADGKFPMLSEPVEGTILIRAPAGLQLYALSGNGTKSIPPAPDYRDGVYEITLPVPLGTHWFILE